MPYAGALAGARWSGSIPLLLDALWKSPDPDEALNQFERFLSAAGPRAGYVELLGRQCPSCSTGWCGSAPAAICSPSS